MSRVLLFYDSVPNKAAINKRLSFMGKILGFLTGWSQGNVTLTANRLASGISLESSRLSQILIWKIFGKCKIQSMADDDKWKSWGPFGPDF